MEPVDMRVIPAGTKLWSPALLAVPSVALGDCPECWCPTSCVGHHPLFCLCLSLLLLCLCLLLPVGHVTQLLPVVSCALVFDHSLLVLSEVVLVAGLCVFLVDFVLCVETLCVVLDRAFVLWCTYFGVTVLCDCNYL